MTQPREPVFTSTVANDSVLNWQKLAEAMRLVRAIGPSPQIVDSAYAPLGGIKVGNVLYVSPSLFRGMKENNDDQGK